MTAPLEFAGDRLLVLDQTLLPNQEVIIELSDARSVAAALARLAVRGAPLIGIAAGYGLALEVAREPNRQALQRGFDVLRVARPTAVNLIWALTRVRGAALSAPENELAVAAREEAVAIHTEENSASDAIAHHGADFLGDSRRLMTICNSGALAAGGRGTGLAVVAEIARRAPSGTVTVLACETRPLLQGARLTVWELARLKIPQVLVADGAAAGIIARGEVDAVVVGCDRVAANGDVANKVGTYGLALAARAAGIPFVVAGPRSTIDLDTPDGGAIHIEERDADEVRYAGGALISLADVPVRNPAFDVTPAALISALVTETGVVARPDTPAIAAHTARSRRPTAP